MRSGKCVRHRAGTALARCHACTHAPAGFVPAHRGGLGGRRLIRAHDQRHPRTLGTREVGAFLTLLATRDRVSASTQ
ncbi:phage integrase N-terminal SAM-like domain-containing protein, partial [Metallibacterium scheffleri]|uniref:phage integrase N-terminal SAM-like domain-containing protein n=1 Tax=Metallibacterium scheffleri TaxID=993689 RepID=UPI003CCFE2BE